MNIIKYERKKERDKKVRKKINFLRSDSRSLFT